MAPQSTGTNGPTGARRRRVERSGRDVLARTRLALDEQRGARRRDALEDRVDLAHREARADELPERIVVRDGDDRVAVDGLDAKHAAAHSNRCAGPHLAVVDLDALDVRSVGAAAVFDGDHLRVYADLAVNARDRVVGEREVARGRAAHARDAVLDSDPASPRGPVDHDELDGRDAHASRFDPNA